jgi:hypothetical protein
LFSEIFVFSQKNGTANGELVTQSLKKIKADSLLLFYFSFYYSINNNHKLCFQEHLFVFLEKWNGKY